MAIQTMKHQKQQKMRRVAEAALEVAKYSSEGTELEAVLLSGLAGELAEQFGFEETPAFVVAEHLAQIARELYAHR